MKASNDYVTFPNSYHLTHLTYTKGKWGVTSHGVITDHMKPKFTEALSTNSKVSKYFK
jgi:hypothetical protein